MKRLEGRRAVVTGGGSGIGKASAIRLAREGASVLVVGRSANTEETVEAIKAEGGVALGMITDASLEDNVAEIVRRCVRGTRRPRGVLRQYRRHRDQYAPLRAERRGVDGRLSHQHGELLPRDQARRTAI